MRFGVPEYYEGTMLFVRDDADDVLAAFAEEQESQAERYVERNGGCISPEDGCFVRIVSPHGDVPPWHGPFDTQEAAREFVQVELEMDPDSGAQLDELGEPIERDEAEFDNGDFY